MKRVLTCAYLVMTCSVGLVLSLGAREARADIIYTFSGVQFSDGGTLTGTFTTDNAISTLLDFDVTTSTQPGFGFNYTSGTVNSGSTSLPTILVFSTASLDNLLEVTFVAPGLTATGAPILIGDFDSFEQGPPPAPGVAGPHRQIVQGEAIVRTSSVPEPSTMALAGIAALAGLLGYVRQRRRA